METPLLPETTARPKRQPAPGGLPDLSRNLLATCVPLGVVSTSLPLFALVVRISPLGAIVSASGSLMAPFEVTSLPVWAVEARLIALGIAAIRLFRLSAT